MTKRNKGQKLSPIKVSFTVSLFLYCICKTVKFIRNLYKNAVKFKKQKEILNLKSGIQTFTGLFLIFGPLKSGALYVCSYKNVKMRA